MKSLRRRSLARRPQASVPRGVIGRAGLSSHAAPGRPTQYAEEADRSTKDTTRWATAASVTLGLAGAVVAHEDRGAYASRRGQALATRALLLERQVAQSV